MNASRVRALLATLASALLVCGLAVLGAGPALAADESGDRILSRDIDYNVAADGTATVSDTIRYRFANTGKARHGIFVDFVVRQDYQNSTTQYRLYPFDLQEIQSPTGANTDVETEGDGPLTRLQIGDKDKEVSGDQVYVINYTVKGIVNAIPTSKDEQANEQIYINPISTQNGVPVDQATVKITAPDPSTGVRCFQGAQGSDQQCQAQAGGTSTFTVTDLAGQQNLTVVASYPTGTFTNTAPILRNGSARSGGGVGENMPVPVAQAFSTAGYGAGTLVPLVALLLMGLLVRRRGRDEYYAGLTPGVAPADGAEGTNRRGSAGPVAVRFEPPDGATPGLIGTVIDETANTVDVSATVIDLAARGFLTIEEIDTGKTSKVDWQLTRIADRDTEPLRQYERRILDGLFEAGDSVTLSELKNHFATTLGLAKSDMYRDVVERGWFRQSPETTRQRWLALAILLAILGGILLFALGFVSPSIDARSGIGFGVPSGVVLGVGLLIASAIVFVLGKRMPAKTAAGSAINAQAAGFRQYLETAEAGQIRFEEASSIFSRYLPYAIIFGCADRWAKVFQDVAQSAQLQGVPIDMPTWYLFYGASSFGSFDGIADGMDSFSTMAAGTFTSTPGASGESGMSGGSFGGGGFSGGGGFGGGSVGSW